MIDTNTTFTGSWDGKTGSLVHNIIVDLVSGIVDTLNLAVSGVSVTKDENLSDAFNVAVNYFGQSEPVVTHIELTPQSEIKAVLLSLTPETEYLVPGNALDVSYTWQVLDEDGSTPISGKVGKITLFVNGISAITVNTVKSAVNLNRQGTITIDGKYFKVGVNNISAYIELNDSGRLALFEEGDEVNDVNVVSFNLNFHSSFRESNISYKTLFEASTKFSFNFEYLDDNNKNLVTNSEYSNFRFSSGETIASKLRTNYIASSGLNDVNSSWAGTSSGEITYSGLFTLYSSGSSRLYLQGCFAYGGKDFYSNGIKYGFVNKSISETNRYAYYIDNYTNYTNTGQIFYPSNKITVTQYKNVTFNIAIYAYNNASVNLVLNDTQIREPILIAANRDVLQDLTWNYTFSTSGLNLLSIGDISYDVNVIALSNDIIIPNDYILSFDAYGKSGETTEATYGDYKINLTGFDFGSNGWIDNALVVNNNAYAVIDCKACQNKNNLVEKSVSIKFKTSNENTNECLISCKQFGCDGFEIYPQRAVLYKGNAAVSTEFSSEDSIKEVTFVWYGSSYGNVGIIYINGTSLAVNVNSASVSNDTNIVINANLTTLYLYNIEVYNRALNFFEVQSISAIHNDKNLSEYIELNNIFDGAISNGNDSNGKGNQEKVTIDLLPVGSTYMLIKAFRNPDDSNDVGESKFWETINNLEDKGVKIIAGNTYLITKTNDNSIGHPSNFFADRIAFYGLGTSSMFYPIKNYRIAFKKNWKEKDMSKELMYSGYDFQNASKMCTRTFVSGTDVTGPNYINNSSSESKKYKLFSRERGDSYDSIPANIFCLKADYAESSGVHNTGFARLANYALESSANIFGLTPESGVDTRIEKHSNIPLNYFDKDNKYRSCIDGRPIYLFFEDLEGNQYYGGKYNLNNEKSSEDVFGFTGSSAYFAKNNGSEVFDLNNANYPMSENQTFSGIENEAEHLKLLFGLTLSDSENYDATHDPVKSGDNVLYINPTECWEFSTNDPQDLSNYDKISDELGWPYANIGAFTYPYTVGDAKNNSAYPFGKNSAYLNYDPFTIRTDPNAKTNPDALAWLDSELAWEFRFPDETGKNVYLAGARPLLLESLYKFLHKNNVYLWSSTIDKMSHANTFAVNLHKYFNVNYLLKYYMMTKWFINADQRIKNCMLSFYYDPYVEDNTDSESPMGHMRAYYLFYDNDTILGVNNTGALTNPWNTDEEVNRFLGIDDNNVSFHGIWGNLEYCYKLYITNTYGEYTAIALLGKLMERAYLSVRDVIKDSKLKEYLGNHFPDSASNIDAEVKYFYPNKLSSYVHSSSSATEFNSTNISKYQGTREFHRDLILSKRTKWFDAQFGGSSINNYAFTFKSSGTRDQFEPGGISVTSYFNKWRFYYIAGEGSETPTSLVNKDQSAQIRVTGAVNSFVLTLCGLYGAKVIDLSGLSGNNTPLLDIGFSNKLPYLLSFILGNNNYPTKIIDNLGTQLFGNNKVINLTKLSLINLLAYNVNTSGWQEDTDYEYNSSFFTDLDIRNLTKLEQLDLSKTLIDVNLSTSPLLLKLYLYKPTKLSLVNKYNLNTLSIEDELNIKTIEINHCNSLVYTWSLNTILNKLTAIVSSGYTVETPNQLTANIVIGHGSQVDALLDSEVILIARIASILKDNAGIPVNISISGLGQNTNINTLSYNGNSCVDLISRMFKDLVILTALTNEFTLSPAGDKYTFVEGESLLIRSSRPVTQWNMTINGIVVELDENSIHSADGNIVLDLQDASQYTCTITANKVYDNEPKSYRIIISADDAENNTVECDPIIASYIPINQITLTPDNNIVSSKATINISVNSNSTKKFLLNQDYIGNLNIGEPTISIKAPKGDISVNSDDDNIIQSLSYTITDLSENKDGDVTFTFNTISATTTIYYDKPIILDKMTITTDNSLRWLNYILTNGFSKLPTTIYRSTLKLYTLTNDTLKNFSNVDGNESYVLNLTYMLYLNLGSTSYTMPSFAFSYAVLPEGLQYLTWKFVDDTNTNNYLKLTLPKSLLRALIKPNATTNPLSNLKIDLNANLNIKKILNAGSDDVARISDGTIDIAFTFESVPTTPKVLFDNYPSSIEEIGWYSEVPNYTESSSTPLSIFNYNQDSSNGVSAFYTFGVPNSPSLKIGKIANYKVSTALFDWDRIAESIVGLYYTFNAGTNASGNAEYQGFSGLGGIKQLNLTNVSFIGDKTFFNCNEEGVNINIDPEKIKSIGYAAFSEFGGTINSTNKLLNFELLSGIGYSGFNHIEGYTFTLPSIITIADYAFNLDYTPGVVANNIYIPNATLSNYYNTSFGNSATYKNNIYIGDLNLYNTMNSNSSLTLYANIIKYNPS